MKWFNIKNLSFIAFRTYHDTAQPCGFLIEFNGKRLVFLTDSSDLRTKFDNVDYWIIEANYSNNKLKKSGLDSKLKKRIQDTHMSIDRCKTILDYHNAKFSVLIHASENHADKDEFIKKIPYAIVAENGMEIELN
jgi:phosphoribosyl 1,2-cyclic phosphodiesterase